MRNREDDPSFKKKNQGPSRLSQRERNEELEDHMERQREMEDGVLVQIELEGVRQGNSLFVKGPEG